LGDFVKLNKSVDFRRNILESSKMIIHIMQDNRKLKIIREKKLKLIDELKDDLKEITLLIDKLDDRMPDKHLREEKPVEEKPVKDKKKPAIEETATDVNRLEYTLEKIEKKLSSLR
jgi:hypothetical protein